MRNQWPGWSRGMYGLLGSGEWLNWLFRDLEVAWLKGQIQGDIEKRHVNELIKVRTQHVGLFVWCHCVWMPTRHHPLETDSKYGRQGNLPCWCKHSNVFTIGSWLEYYSGWVRDAVYIWLKSMGFLSRELVASELHWIFLLWSRCGWYILGLASILGTGLPSPPAVPWPAPLLRT